MPTPNQLFVRREDVKIGPRDLLNMNVPGKITEEGIRKNLAIGLGYMEAWIRGVGCVPINYLMYVSHTLIPQPRLRLAKSLDLFTNQISPRNREDAATAEVSRSQLWQWVRHSVTTAEGKKVDKAYTLRLLKEETDRLAAKAPAGNKFGLASQYFAGQVTGEDYADFLTTLLYNEITAVGSAAPASKL